MASKVFDIGAALGFFPPTEKIIDVIDRNRRLFGRRECGGKRRPERNRAKGRFVFHRYGRKIMQRAVSAIHHRLLSRRACRIP